MLLAILFLDSPNTLYHSFILPVKRQSNKLAYHMALFLVLQLPLPRSFWFLYLQGFRYVINTFRWLQQFIESTYHFSVKAYLEPWRSLFLERKKGGIISIKALYNRRRVCCHDLGAFFLSMWNPVYTYDRLLRHERGACQSKVKACVDSIGTRLANHEWQLRRG
jgi:hypothetical protein